MKSKMIFKKLLLSFLAITLLGLFNESYADSTKVKKLKSPFVAQMLSASGTFFPLVGGTIMGQYYNGPYRDQKIEAMFASGLILGPSLGSIYAKDYKSVLIGLSVRGGTYIIARTCFVGGVKSRNSMLVLFSVGGFTYLYFSFFA